VSSLNRGASDEVEGATIWRAATVDVRMSRLILAPGQPTLVRASIKIQGHHYCWTARPHEDYDSALLLTLFLLIRTVRYAGDARYLKTNFDSRGLAVG
jgi:hypothetical protein